MGMIFRHRKGRNYFKLHAPILSLPRYWFKPLAVANMGNCKVEEFLCPRIRDFDWHVFTKQGVNIERWFKKHGKGAMLISAIESDDILPTYHRVKLSFTDPNTAIFCKLQLGGI